jgi:tRNA (cmo5U34)-methyltransferase
VSNTWRDEDKVHEYVGRVGRLAARSAGEAELVEALPANVERILDLGCGDGRLVSSVLQARPAAIGAIGLDNSPPMIELARERFRGDERVTIQEHDLNDPIPTGHAFDVVVSGFATALTDP